MCDAPAEGKAAQPRALFEAPCDHAGYVAANLAVRWHPRSGQLYHIDSAPGGRLTVAERDLATGAKRRAFPQDADALLFDWTPDGRHLVCVCGSKGAEGRMIDATGAKPGDAQCDGIWIGQPSEGKWWHVPGSAILADSELPSLLECLRATRPVWSADGQRFAFTTTPRKKNKDEPDRHRLHVGTLEGRAVKTVAEGAEPFRDLRWAPDGQRLGVLRGRQLGALHVLDQEGRLSKPINQRPVRRFAGWDRTGEHLAYVVPDRIPLAGAEPWAFLLVADPLARDAVFLAPGDASQHGREVFSGMRVTFPEWSPQDEELSLWFTFSPTHRSLRSRLLRGFGLLPGDPAAVFAPKTGTVRWLAVNAREKAQVGHYYLLKGEPAEAWRWYEAAERDLPPADGGRAAERLIDGSDFTLFQYHCLKKLGRDQEAQAKRDAFRRTFQPGLGDLIDTAPQPQPAPEEPWQKQSRRTWAALLRDLYAAEVFLSLDAAEDGCTLLRELLDTADTDEERLAAALVLGQVLLLQQKHAAYADLMTDTALPLLLDYGQRQAGAWRQEVDAKLLRLLAGLALTPLFCPEFLALLPVEQVERLAVRWSAARVKAADDPCRLAADLVLHAAYRRLGRDGERQEAARRIRQNPAARDYLPEGSPDNLAAAVRKTLSAGVAQTDSLRQLVNSPDSNRGD